MLSCKVLFINVFSVFPGSRAGIPEKPNYSLLGSGLFGVAEEENQSKSKQKRRQENQESIFDRFGVAFMRRF
jgi:hypothetical protein